MAHNTVMGVTVISERFKNCDMHLVQWSAAPGLRKLSKCREATHDKDGINGRAPSRDKISVLAVDSKNYVS